MIKFWRPRILVRWMIGGAMKEEHYSVALEKSAAANLGEVEDRRENY